MVKCLFQGMILNALNKNQKNVYSLLNKQKKVEDKFLWMKQRARIAGESTIGD